MWEVEEAEMAWSGEKAASGRDELTFVDEALEHFAQGVVTLDAEAREGEGVEGRLALTQGVQQVLALAGMGGGILLGERVVGLAEPEEDGQMLLGGSDEAGLGRGLGTQAVFGTVQHECFFVDGVG